jgi:6-phosphogluconolactonase/glucosamine-6-phosphate isomerase/deaminase
MEVFPDTRALMEAEAGRIVSVARRAIAVRNGCQLALSGGAISLTTGTQLFATARNVKASGSGPTVA